MQFLENLLVYVWLGWLIYELISGIVCIAKDITPIFSFRHLNPRKVKLVSAFMFCLFSLIIGCTIYFFNHKT